MFVVGIDDPRGTKDLITVGVCYKTVFSSDQSLAKTAGVWQKLSKLVSFVRFVVCGNFS